MRYPAFPKFDQKKIELLRIRCSLLLNHSTPISDVMKIDHLTSGPKTAAVLVPFCNFQGVPSLIFTLRSTAVSTHKGQVSFPGGHINDGEGAIEAAIRETKEELGIGIGEIEIVTQLQAISAITGTMVTPVIGFLTKDFTDYSSFTPNPDEVERVFIRSIDQLIRPEYRTFETFHRDGSSTNIPVFGANEKEERIWGLTAFILGNVLDNIIVQKTG